MTQNATFGTEQLTSQRRPPEFMLHDDMPVALPPLLLVLLVLVKTLVALLPLGLLPVLVLMLVSLLLTLLLVVTLLKVEAAPAPLTAKHSRRTR